jgi:hypothetical protein
MSIGQGAKLIERAHQINFKFISQIIKELIKLLEAILTVYTWSVC